MGPKHSLIIPTYFSALPLSSLTPKREAERRGRGVEVCQGQTVVLLLRGGQDHPGALQPGPQPQDPAGPGHGPQRHAAAPPGRARRPRAGHRPAQPGTEPCSHLKLL